MTSDQLKEVLRLHALWLIDDIAGQRADLCGADLTRANLTRANLCGADLNGANLTRANLYGADLCGANLCGADLNGANLTRANLCGADLNGANLTRANLYGANHLDKALNCHRSIVPEAGPFYGYKKLRSGAIATLYIPRSAGRVGGLTGRKCRASKAKVVAMTEAGVQGRVSDVSKHDRTFEYVVGKWAKPSASSPWDPDVRLECTGGIHFFITKREAEEY
jgi:hypothetical protein